MTEPPPLKRQKLPDPATIKAKNFMEFLKKGGEPDANISSAEAARYKRDKLAAARKKREMEEYTRYRDGKPRSELAPTPIAPRTTAATAATAAAAAAAAANAVKKTIFRGGGSRKKSKKSGKSKKPRKPRKQRKSRKSRKSRK